MRTEQNLIHAQEYRILLGKVLKKSPEWVFMHLPALTLSNDKKQKLEKLIKRRLKGEPIAKIVGHKEFYGREFFTNKYTLDPRPDSETIIEAIKKYFPKDNPYSILDLGTGTGCLLFTILQEFPHARGLGVDYSWNALKVAQKNQVHFKLCSRSSLIQGNWTKALQSKFDIILCNPPYISTNEKLDTSTLYDPNLALFSGLTGLEAYKTILPTISGLLKQNGLIFLEIGKGQEHCVQNIALTNKLIEKQTFTDLSGIMRVLCYSLSKD